MECAQRAGPRSGALPAPWHGTHGRFIRKALFFAYGMNPGHPTQADRPRGQARPVGDPFEVRAGSSQNIDALHALRFGS